ncbi:hypothetical protein FRC17_008495 [Serendipita sp. 399]|nr:hypothetical protein FRC17_008495 [Serendipita sp. 399]
MLVLTVHPRYWTERQQVLRERERELRVLYGPLRENQEEEAEGHAAAITNGEALNGSSTGGGSGGEKEKQTNGDAAAAAAANPRPPGGWYFVKYKTPLTS